MITLEVAEQIAEVELKKYEQTLGDISLKIIKASTIEEDFGWIFFYNTLEFLESGDLSYALTGNAPIIVDRGDGSLHVTGTAYPIDYYIKKYRQNRRPRRR